MALIKCKECSNEVSNKAKSCPKCGARIGNSGFLKFLVLIILLVVLASAINQNKDEHQRVAEAQPTAKSSTEKATYEAEKASSNHIDDAKMACKIFVEKTLDDPDSAQFDDLSAYPAKEEKNGIYHVQVYLRARNGFNAMRRVVIDCETRFDGSNWAAIQLNEIH